MSSTKQARSEGAASEVKGNNRQMSDSETLVDARYEQKREITGIRWVLIIVSILSASGLYALDNTIVADLQPSIIGTLGEYEKMPWVSVGTLLGCLATNSAWGKIFGLFNTKWTYIVSVVIFEVGSAVCGAAPNMNALIIARVIQGIGGVGIYLGVMTLMSINTTRKERPMYISLAGIAWGIGTVCGPIIGGAFAVSAVGWRWAFYINLLFAIFQLPIAVFMIPSFDPRPKMGWKERLAQIDYVGTILMIGATVSLVVAINCGGQLYPWNSGQIIACFVVSGVLFIALGFQQSYCYLTSRVNRIFPCQFVAQPIFVNLFCQAACVAAISFIAIFYVPVFFQYTRSDTAIEAGVRLLPLVCFMAVTQLMSGGLMSKLGYYMPWYLGGAVLCLIGSALMHTVRLETAAANIYGYTILIGFGGGLYSQAGFAVAQVKARPSEAPDASGFIALGQLAGATIALAIANTLFLGQSTDSVLAELPGTARAEVQRIIVGGDRAELRDEFAPDVQNLVLQAISSAVANTYILAITAASFSVALAVFLPIEKIFHSSGSESAISVDSADEESGSKREKDNNE